MDDEYSFGFSSQNPDEPVATIADGVSSVKKVDVTELDPLQWTIDVEALNDLITHNPVSKYRSAASGDGPSRKDADSTGLKVRFRYEGCTITVTHDTVHIVPE